ncbi:MAG: hypothetical protein IT405_03210 [Candidatus Yanofskybacteria bacterium]|nr:hypothetical protein [Candidatus Yanofskybacteria bacterium]
MVRGEQLKKCIRKGCNAFARYRSNYCGACWDGMHAEWQARREERDRVISATMFAEVLLAVLVLFIGALLVNSLM